MIGELTSRQILSLSAEGLSADEISKELTVDESLVKLVLSSHNSGSASDRDINDAQLALLRERAFGLAMNEDPTVAARMVMFLIERDKPRLKAEPSNVTLINNAIISAQSNFQKLADSFSDNDSDQIS